MICEKLSRATSWSFSGQVPGIPQNLDSEIKNLNFVKLYQENMLRWEDKVKQLLPELAKIFEGFPSCNKLHNAPVFLSLYSETSKVYNREEIKRLNGLSVFIGGTEQRTQNKEYLQKPEKFKKLGSPSRYNSDYKSWAKSIWSSTKRKRTQTGPIFYKKGEKVVFNFQHYVKPEQLVKEYVQANIYNKPRLIRVDKKETKSSPSDNQTSTEVDLQSCKFKDRSKSEKSQISFKINERRISGWRLNKSTESTKKTQRVPKRISATHNFVYEFNPLASSSATPNNVGKKKGSQYVSNIGQGDSVLKSTNFKQNLHTVHETFEAALPKLHPRTDTMIDSLGKQRNVTSYNKNTNLPRIKGQEEMADQRLVKDREKRDPLDEINREVEKVKTDWQALRSGNEWMQSKCFANVRTRKLYDTLEKMTQEINKIQKSYLDPKSCQYLQRSAAKLLDVPRQSFEQNAEQIKSMLFPKTNKKMVNETNNASKIAVQDETSPNKMYTNKQFESRSLLTSMRSRNPKSNLKSSPLNFNRQDINANDRKSLKNMDSDIQQYFESYISDAERNFVGKEEPNIRELDPSPADVKEMLKKLNIHSGDMYDIMSCQSEYEEDSLLQDINRKINAGTSARTPVYEKPDKLIITEETAEENLSQEEEDQLISYNNVPNADFSIQTNSKPTYSGNAFIEMGLNTLNTNLPCNTFSHILHSEYLKKDMTLKPM